MNANVAAPCQILQEVNEKSRTSGLLPGLTRQEMNPGRYERLAPVFSVRVKVRGYELDLNGHVNQAVYMQYGEHARWECIKAAGVSTEAMTSAGLGFIVLELTIRFLSELRDGDELDVTCAYEPKGGKTVTIRHELRRTDGVLAAEITGVGGLLDHAERRLIPEPLERLKALAADPDVLG